MTTSTTMRRRARSQAGSRALPDQARERNDGDHRDRLREVRKDEQRRRASQRARGERLVLEQQPRDGVERGREEKHHRRVGREGAAVIDASRKDGEEERGGEPGARALEKPAPERRDDGDRAEAERHGDQAPEDRVDAEHL